jgi:hypothetical protein
MVELKRLLIDSNGYVCGVTSIMSLVEGDDPTEEKLPVPEDSPYTYQLLDSEFNTSIFDAPTPDLVGVVRYHLERQRLEYVETGEEYINE